MLIIPRGREESIVIGDNVIVTVEEIGGAEVRLRIEHPEDASVRPGEALVAAEWESSL
ncbi:MAG: carbon storage regulator [Thermoguttaceae bacterium]|jgi:carbon storage regulator